MPNHNFLDTSAVSLAVALSDASLPSELPSGLVLYRVPFRSESYAASKSSQMSQAISSSRRDTNQKNTSGTATGGMTVEMGKVSFITLLIQAAMMSEFKTVSGSGGTQISKLVDSDTKRYLFTEKRESLGNGQFEYHNHYSQLVGQMTLSFQQAEISTVEFTTSSSYYDQDTGDVSKSKATSYVESGDYELMDSSNNVDAIKFYDRDTGKPLDMYFSTATITINNNVRSQGAIGHVWAPGMGTGKFNVQFTGTAYYENANLQRRHMNNGRVAVRVTLRSTDGTLVFFFPNMSVDAPSSNSQGENQDYNMEITLNGLEGDVSIGGTAEKASLVILSGPGSMDENTVGPVTPAPAPAAASSGSKAKSTS